MGLFSFFSRSKSSGAQQGEKRALRTMPTLPTPPELAPAYDRAFAEMMASVDGFSKAEKEDIHRMIKTCEGGHVNMSGYYHQVFDKYFKRREWSWGEFNKWQAAFDKLGEYPGRWPRDRGGIEDKGILEMFRVGELKALLATYNVELSPKAKKADLVALVLANQTLLDAALCTPEAIATKERYRFDLGGEMYALLIQGIASRASAYAGDKRIADLGAKGLMKRKLIMIVGEEKFVKLALTENPDALPPFFPGDFSMYNFTIDI